jgi:uncharacterized membrane protein YidH (DUF202 family)
MKHMEIIMNIDTLSGAIKSLLDVLGVNYLCPEILITILASMIVIIGISILFQDTKKFVNSFSALIRLERRSNTPNTSCIYDRRHKPDSRIPFYVSTKMYILCFTVFTLLYILTSPFKIIYN